MIAVGDLDEFHLRATRLDVRVNLRRDARAAVALDEQRRYLDALPVWDSVQAFADGVDIPVELVPPAAIGKLFGTICSHMTDDVGRCERAGRQHAVARD